MDVKDFVEVGRVVKTHGVSGELIIELDNPSILEDSNEPVVLEIEGLRVPFFIKQAQAVSAQRARVQFDCTRTEQRAKTLVGCKVFVNPAIFDDIDDEYASPNAIVGFSVVDKKHGDIGKVQSVENLNVNPIMVVGEKQTLVPFHPEFVTKIDFRKHQVRVSLPDGLLEINE
ncbi:MAG: 16S rRNA processing protein RimM [Salinivirgaceae bacterium]|jgi:16S rRNA processing protein RimM|nr:16S rRNA processing protein RimM [Salinivirgaceae bacterium]